MTLDYLTVVLCMSVYVFHIEVNDPKRTVACGIPIGPTVRRNFGPFGT